eukprot:1161181-Pelagomonas_calceolata.AAC.7
MQAPHLTGTPTLPDPSDCCLPPGRCWRSTSANTLRRFSIRPAQGHTAVKANSEGWQTLPAPSHTSLHESHISFKTTSSSGHISHSKLQVVTLKTTSGHTEGANKHTHALVPVSIIAHKTMVPFLVEQFVVYSLKQREQAGMPKQLATGVSTPTMKLCYMILTWLGLAKVVVLEVAVPRHHLQPCSWERAPHRGQYE